MYRNTPIFGYKEGLLQNAVFRPKRKICTLKKLARTAALTVLANFFFGLIFQNSILQKAHGRSVMIGLGKIQSYQWF